MDNTHIENTTRLGLELQQVFMVPKITKNLLSVSKSFKDNSCNLEFDKSDFVIKGNKIRTLLTNQKI